MAETAIRKAAKIERETLDSIEKAYADVTAPIVKRHEKTMEEFQALIKQGKNGRARALLRSSGLLDDLARAIAAAGRRADEVTIHQRRRILEVMAHDDGS